MHITPLTDQALDSWANLLAICFHRTPAEMEVLLRWLGVMGKVVAWGAWEDDQLVAQYACLIRPVRAYGTTFPAGMSMNMAVHPDYRGAGLIKRVAEPVYESVREQGGLIGLGFSNAAGVRVDRKSKSYGYQVIGQMQPVIGLLRHAAHPDIQLCDDLPRSISTFPANGTHDGITFLKTPADFVSRYAAHPFRRYQYGIWQEGDRVYGIIVYREIQIAGIPGVALLDAWGTDLHALFAQWSGAVRQAGALVVHALLTPTHPLKQTCAAIMPLFPQPYTRNPYYLTLKPLGQNHPDYLFDFDSWHFVGGDIL